MSTLLQHAPQYSFPSTIAGHGYEFVAESVDQGRLSWHFKREAPSFFLTGFRKRTRHGCQPKVTHEMPRLVNQIESKGSPTNTSIGSKLQHERCRWLRNPVSQTPRTFDDLFGGRIGSGFSGPPIHGSTNLDLNEMGIFIHNAHRNERGCWGHWALSFWTEDYHALVTAARSSDRSPSEGA